MIQDESVQKKGFVFLNFTFEKTNMMMSILAGRAKNVGDLDAALPLKLVAFHYCYDDHRIRPFAEMVQMAFGSNTRLRLQMHYGKMLILGQLV